MKRMIKNLCSLCAFLTLIVVPTIQHGPQVFSTIEGIPVTLPCKAIGVPAPEISWTKVGFFCQLLVKKNLTVSLTTPSKPAIKKKGLKKELEVQSTVK